MMHFAGHPNRNTPDAIRTLSFHSGQAVAWPERKQRTRDIPLRFVAAIACVRRFDPAEGRKFPNKGAQKQRLRRVAQNRVAAWAQRAQQTTSPQRSEPAQAKERNVPVKGFAVVDHEDQWKKTDEGINLEENCRAHFQEDEYQQQ